MLFNSHSKAFSLDKHTVCYDGDILGCDALSVCFGEKVLSVFNQSLSCPLPTDMGTCFFYTPLEASGTWPPLTPPCRHPRQRPRPCHTLAPCPRSRWMTLTSTWSSRTARSIGKETHNCEPLSYVQDGRTVGETQI